MVGINIRPSTKRAVRSVLARNKLVEQWHPFSIIRRLEHSICGGGSHCSPIFQSVCACTSEVANSIFDDPHTRGSQLSPLNVVLNFEGHTVTRMEFIHVHEGPDVHENVGASIVGDDEAKPALVRKRLNPTRCHLPVS
jgi:hypothetical protein